MLHDVDFALRSEALSSHSSCLSRSLLQMASRGLLSGIMKSFIALISALDKMENRHVSLCKRWPDSKQTARQLKCQINLSSDQVENSWNVSPCNTTESDRNIGAVLLSKFSRHFSRRLAADDLFWEERMFYRETQQTPMIELRVWAVQSVTEFYLILILKSGAGKEKAVPHLAATCWKHVRTD